MPLKRNLTLLISLPRLYLQSGSQIYINEARWLFWGWFWPLLNWTLFLEAAGAGLKIGSSLKLNHHQEIQLAQTVKLSVGQSMNRLPENENGVLKV